MQCLLLRHGIAESPHEWAGDEFTRPLTDEGVTKTQHAVEGLKRTGVHPTHLLCSPLTRTRQTAEIAQKVLRIDSEMIITPELIYDQSPLLLFPLFQELPQESLVMCVGHEPHLGQATSLMVFGTHSNGLSVKKAGACLISFFGTAEIGKGYLEWWIPPAQLRALRKG